MKIAKIIKILLLLILSNQLIAQNNLYDTHNLISNKLEKLVKNEFGEKYSCNYWIFDSINIHQKDYLSTNKYFDPYNTLKNCVIFYAYPENQENKINNICSIGLYKDGRILWHSDLIISNYIAKLKYIGEINNDNRVEIILSVSAISKFSPERLWIVSWDGVNGWIINDYDQTNGYSRLLVNGFTLVEKHNSRVSDIFGIVPNNIEQNSWYPIEKITAINRVTYGWNGDRYGLWDDTEQIDEYEFLPAEKLDVIIEATVTKNDFNFIYSYKILNSNTSAQDIGRIYLFNVNSEGESFSPISRFDDWLTGKLKIIDNCVWWANTGMDFSALIHPGEEKSGFSLKNEYFPHIIKFFIQASVQFPTIFDSTDNLINAHSLLDDILNNSKSGCTIGPREFHLPILCDKMIDSVIYYSDESLNQDWIKDEQTYLKYNTLLTKAKKNLEQNDSNFAKVYLQKVIKNTIEDSSSVLTSEAFALLYFNTEYLVDQLPEINIADMFERLITEIEECKLSGSITNKGIYNSLKKKAENAKKSYEKDNKHSSVQKLKAFQNELRAQKDKHVSIECTEALDEYSGIIIELLEE